MTGTNRPAEEPAPFPLLRVFVLTAGRCIAAYFKVSLSLYHSSTLTDGERKQQNKFNKTKTDLEESVNVQESLIELHAAC